MRNTIKIKDLCEKYNIEYKLPDTILDIVLECSLDDFDRGYKYKDNILFKGTRNNSNAELELSINLIDFDYEFIDKIIEAMKKPSEEISLSQKELDLFKSYSDKETVVYLIKIKNNSTYMASYNLFGGIIRHT